MNPADSSQNVQSIAPIEGVPVGEMTIDELAQHTGMTVRNIRAHQSRGLLPAPDVKGRIGYYNGRHVARLELIQQLQSGGFNLTAIQRLVERAEQTGDDIGNLRSLVLTPFAEEQSEVVDLYELAQQLGVEVDSKILRKAIDLGFVVPLDGQRFEVLSPTIMRAGVQCVELGISLETLLDVLSMVHSHSRAIADAFTKMVDVGIVRPFEKDGFPPESFPQVVAAITALRPLAAEVMLAGFKVNMDGAAEDAFGKILNRIAKENIKPQPAENGAEPSQGRSSHGRSSKDSSSRSSSSSRKRSGRRSSSR
ncbi:MAG: MerR family transcriptional regulator [Solirubrobacterales bacterium]